MQHTKDEIRDLSDEEISCSNSMEISKFTLTNFTSKLIDF